ncbi:hypothetical protein ABK040_007882 [Willaertia magna]
MKHLPTATTKATSPTTELKNTNNAKIKKKKGPKRKVIDRIEMIKHFCYPQPKAAKLLGVSVSTLKRRFYEMQFGSKWPYPCSKSKDKSMQEVMKDIKVQNDEEKRLLLKVITSDEGDFIEDDEITDEAGEEATETNYSTDSQNESCTSKDSQSIKSILNDEPCENPKNIDLSTLCFLLKAFETYSPYSSSCPRIL